MTSATWNEPCDKRPARRRTYLHIGILTVIAASLLSTLSVAVAAPPTLEELRQTVAADPEAIDAGATLTHLAEALLFQLSTDGADVAALFGVPTRDQIDRVYDAATEARRLTRQAEELLTHSVKRIGADPDFADRRDLQDQRSSYEVEYLLTRLPLARARSLAMLAILSTSTAESVRLADDARVALDIIESDRAMIRAHRFSLTAAAKQVRGNSIDTAYIEQVIEFVDSDEFDEVSSRAPQIGREARAAVVSLLWQSGRYEQAQQFIIRHSDADRDDVLTGVIQRDLLARIALARAARSTSRADRERAVIDAINALADEDAVSSRGLLDLALSKIEQIVPAEKMKMELPIAGRIARGRRLLERGDASGAVEMLQSAWDVLDASDPALMQACGWPLAKTLRARAAGVMDMARAGRILLTLATIAESESASASALQSAVDLLQWSIDNAVRPDDSTSVLMIKESLRTALRSALERWPASPSADSWRLRLSGLTGPTQRRKLLESITQQSELYPRARLALAWIEFEELNKTTSTAQREAVAFTMLQFTQQAHHAFQTGLGNDDDSPDIHQVDAIASAELRRFDHAAAQALEWDDAGGASSPDAVEYVRTILSLALNDALFVEDSKQTATLATTLAIVSGRVLTRAEDGRGNRSIVDSAVLDLARSLLIFDPDNDHTGAIQEWVDRFDISRGVGVALAMTHHAISDDQRAFALYRQVVEASRALDVNDEFFWRAWIGMLTILSDHNEAGDRSETILRHISQLRAVDSLLGGRLMRRRLEALEHSARAAQQP